MRKDVKRSLVIWPLVSSAAIIGMTSLAIVATSKSVPTLSTDIISVSSVAMNSWMKLHEHSFADENDMTTGRRIGFSSIEEELVLAPLDESGAEIIERVEHGSRAMKVPDRLAFILGSEFEVGRSQEPKINVRGGLTGVSSPFPSTDPVMIESSVVSKIRPSAAPEVSGLQRSSVLPESISALAKVVPLIAEPNYEIDDLFTNSSDPLDKTTNSLTSVSTTKPSSETSESSDVENETGSVRETLQLSVPSPLETSRSELSQPEPSELSQPEPSELSQLEPAQPQENAVDGFVAEREPYEIESQVEASDVHRDARQDPKLVATTQLLGSPAGWPITFTLNDQLSTLVTDARPSKDSSQTLVSSVDHSKERADEGHESKALWAMQVGETLAKLQSLDRLGDDQAGDLLSQLDSLATTGLGNAEQLRDDAARVQWLLAAFAVARRTAVWKPVWEVASGHTIVHESFDPNRSGTSTAIDYAALLNELEQTELNSIESSSTRIMQAIHALRGSDNEQLTNVASAIDTHYRNANLRIAISSEMLGRLLPSIEPKSVPIRTTVLGSRVHGNSRVESDLKLVLNPSPDRWSINLQALGKVKTQSIGYNGPVSLRTFGQSRFVAATPIVVTREGVRIGDPNVSVNGTTNLRGVQSKYDSWPLVSGLVRNIAISRYETIAPRSNKIANQKMRAQIAETIDQTIETRIADATQRLGQAVLGPLGRLQLDPKVIDMQTTNERLLARYRLAGDQQLAAFTPRPRAPRESLMSAQVHQSAINNMLEQLVPTGKEKSVEDAIAEALNVLGAADAQLPDDLPEDVTIQFAAHRPIAIEVDKDQLWVTMRILRLNRGDNLRLNRFIVRAAYQAEVDGINVSLVRDGHLRISGNGMSMRERLPVRAIFNKVLSPNRKIPLTLPQLTEQTAVEDLVVTQLELRDGWIGMAVGHDDAPKLALAARRQIASSPKPASDQEIPASSQR